MPATRRAKPKSQPDAIALLKADHRKVDGLFKKSEKAKGSAKQKLVQQICDELTIHTTIEEEIFYPACRAKKVEEDKMDEAQVEHDGAKDLIDQLRDASPEADMYDAKVKVLSEYIKHHVKEEEKPRTGVFAEAKRKGVDLAALGAKMKARKEELMGKANSGRLSSRPESNSESKPASGPAATNSGSKLRDLAQAAKRATFG